MALVISRVFYRAVISYRTVISIIEISSTKNKSLFRLGSISSSTKDEITLTSHLHNDETVVEHQNETMRKYICKFFAVVI